MALLANKEGGAHVQPTLTAHYEKLKTQGSGVSYWNEDNPDPTPMTQEEHVCLRQIAYEVLETLAAIESREAPRNSGDDRPTAFEFPVYLFIRDKPETPVNEIAVATIQSLDDLLPVFTTIEHAETAREVLVGDYDIQKLGKNGFTRFLTQVVLPRRIWFLAFNPDVTSENRRLIQRISVAQLVHDLENVPTESEIEKQIADNKMKKI